jgi:hypothetical protein
MFELDTHSNLYFFFFFLTMIGIWGLGWVWVAYGVLVSSVVASVVLVFVLLEVGLLVEEAVDDVAVLEDPLALAARLVVGKLALVVLAVGEDPAAGHDLVVLPVAEELEVMGVGKGYSHAGLGVGVGPLAALDAVLPPAGVGVAVRVVEGALTVSPAVLVEA